LNCRLNVSEVGITSGITAALQTGDGTGRPRWDVGRGPNRPQRRAIG